MAPDHVIRAQQAWPHLVARAKAVDPTPFTYGEISQLIGTHHRAAGYFLGVIQRYCHANKLPPLQALAVNKKTGLPGPGYYGSARNKKQHADALSLIRHFDWPKRPPNMNAYR